MQNDHNFDALAQKFARNIYDSSKGVIRTEVVWQDLTVALARFGTRKLRILDAGGGFGFFTQKLAQLGHEIVLCDLSAEMLALADKNLTEASVRERVTLIHCSIQELPQHVGGQFDLVLCHAVLEWLAEPEFTLKGLFNYLAVGGTLSLLFYNRLGLLFQSLVVGNFDYVEAGLRKKKQTALTPHTPHDPNEVYRWVEEGGLTIFAKSGVRVIHDYMRHKEEQRTKLAQLLEMEQRYCREEPFISLGRYIHLMAERLPE